MPRYKYEDVKSKIKETATVFWYDDKSNLLLKGLSKSKTMDKIEKNKYEGKLYRLSVSFHSGDKKFQGGPLAVRCYEYIKEDNEVTRLKSKQNGTIWIEKEYLESSGFSKFNGMIDIISNRLKKGLEFGFGVYRFGSIL